MSESEKRFLSKVKNSTFEHKRGGYPDFLLFKKTNDKIEFCFVEVKKYPDSLNPVQKKVITLLKYCGVPIEIIKDNELEKVDINNIKTRTIKKSEFTELFKEVRNLWKKKN